MYTKVETYFEKSGPMGRAHAARRVDGQASYSSPENNRGYAFFDGHTDLHVCKCYVLHKKLA